MNFSSNGVSALLFDLNGTIINTLEADFVAMRAKLALALLGPEHVERFVREYPIIPGKGSDRVMRLLHTVFDCHVYAESEVRSIYEAITRRAMQAASIHFIDGFCAFHEQIKRSKLKSALVTNTPAYLLEAYIPKLDLETIFGQHIFTSCAVNYVSKPDPALYVYAMKQLEVEPHQCIIFEDSVNGIEAARRAGVRCIIGVNSHDNSYELDRADVIISNYNELTVSEIGEILVS